MGFPERAARARSLGVPMSMRREREERCVAGALGAALATASTLGEMLSPE
jgi:hypothetical protein